MELIDYLRLARELTSSTDVKELMLSAKYLQAEMETSPAVANKPESASMSWLNVRSVADFIPNTKIQHPIHGPVPFVPFDYQTTMATAIEATHKSVVLVNAARQMGMATTMAAIVLYRAATRPNHISLILSNKFAESLAIMDRVRLMVETCDLPLPFVSEFNKGSITFNNGSKIIARALSEDVNRGYTFDTIMVNDAAYLSWAKEEKWWASVQPSLTKKSQVIMVSSPNMEKGLFYNLWEKDAEQAGLLKLKITWRDHPERDEVWAKFYREQLGADGFAREYEGKFLPYSEHKV